LSARRPMRHCRRHAATPRHPATPPRPLRAALVLLVLVTAVPGPAVVGAVDSRAHQVSRSATLPHRGPRLNEVALLRGRVATWERPGAAWERKVRARYAILVDPATGEVLWGAAEP
jgi:hypothetical protein